MINELINIEAPKIYGWLLTYLKDLSEPHRKLLEEQYRKDAKTLARSRVEHAIQKEAKHRRVIQ